jgi:hypothetical protein
LQTPRTINGVSFDGTGNIIITAAADGGTAAACSGNAATATKLATARTINGVDFDGSANITIPITDVSGYQFRVVHGGSSADGLRRIQIYVPSYTANGFTTSGWYDIYYSSWKPMSCFITGSMILMSDYTLRPIEELTAGDKIIGKDGSVNTVRFKYESILGNKRSVFTFADKSLFWSGEHPLWIRTLDGEEYFGVYDYNQYARERNEELIDPNTYEKIVHRGLTKKDPIVITSPVFFCTLEGWRLDDAFIDKSFSADTKIYSLYTDGSHTMYVNGYLASAFATDIDYDYL